MVLSKIRETIRSKLKRKEAAWHEFKLTITEPPRYNGHFSLIKAKLVPFAKQHSLNFWITNYHNQTYDYILFRVRSSEKKLQQVKNYLDTLKNANMIVGWEDSPWDPAVDARNRIEGLRNKLQAIHFDPNNQVIAKYERTTNTVYVTVNANLAERQKQLTDLFESVGECSKILYEKLSQKPDDPWAISLFLHLLLNSLDFSGPDPTSEEDNIRNIPPF